MHYKFWIYKITNNITNKIYIGQTNNLYNRLKSHKACRDKKTLIVKSISKYGWENHNSEVLFFSENISREDADNVEIFYIKKYNSYIKNNKLGLNLTEGGSPGRTCKKSYIKQGENAFVKWKRKIDREHSCIVLFDTNGSFVRKLYGDSMKEILSSVSESSKYKINEARRWIAKNKWTTVDKKYIIGFEEDNPYQLFLKEKERKVRHINSIANNEAGTKCLMDYHKNIHDKPVLDLNTGVFFETTTDFCRHEGRSHATILERFKKGKYEGRYILCRN